MKAHWFTGFPPNSHWDADFVLGNNYQAQSPNLRAGDGISLNLHQSIAWGGDGWSRFICKGGGGVRGEAWEADRWCYQPRKQGPWALVSAEAWPPRIV